MKLTAALAATAMVAVTASPAFALGNPASLLCERYRGELVIVRDRSGLEYGLCQLPDGYIIEEWTLLRMQQERQPIHVYPQDKGPVYYED